MDGAELARADRRSRHADVVVNCLGVLQDGPGSDTARRASRFRRAVVAGDQAIPAATIRLVHISIPGAATDDRTAFSRDQARGRTADRGHPASPTPSCGRALSSRPSAYGGSAMMRALAALPFDACPARDRATPFQPVAVEDIAATIAWLAGRDLGRQDASAVTWDLMQPRAGYAWRRDRTISRARSAPATSRASRCPPSCSISARASAISQAGSAGCRRYAATAIAELRRGVQRRSARMDRGHRHRAADACASSWAAAPPPSRTNGSPGCT